MAIHRESETPLSVDNAGFPSEDESRVSFCSVAAWAFSEATGCGSRDVCSFASSDVRPMLMLGL